MNQVVRLSHVVEECSRLLQELASTIGPYDLKKRLLIVESWAPRSWGFHDTSARKAPGQWYNLPAGASHLNFLNTVRATANLYLNEVLPILFRHSDEWVNFWDSMSRLMPLVYAIKQ